MAGQEGTPRAYVQVGTEMMLEAGERIGGIRELSGFRPGWLFEILSFGIRKYCTVSRAGRVRELNELNESTSFPCPELN